MGMTDKEIIEDLQKQIRAYSQRDSLYKCRNCPEYGRNGYTCHNCGWDPDDNTEDE